MLIPFTKSTLPNGVRVIFAPLTHTRAVSVLVLFKTGSKYETKRINGISHYLEHMFFKGTKKRPDKRQIAELLDGVGAEFNAFTSDESTGYYVKVERTHTSLALDVVSDILLNSMFPQNEMAREKNVIIEEINMIADTPMRQVHEYWEELLYGDQPAGRPVAGTRDGVKKITRNDLVSYFEKQYRSESMVVCIAGNFPQEKIHDEIKKRFAAMRKGIAQDKQPVVENQHGAQVYLASSKTGQSHILLGVRTFPLSDTRKYALSVLSTILGGGMSSRLFLSVREDKGLVYYIRTQSEMTTDTGYMNTAAGVDSARLELAIKAIMKEYRDIKNKGVTAAELKKAKSSLRGRMLIGLEETDDIASFLAGQELLENEIRDPEEEMDFIDKVKASEVQQVAKDIFTEDKINLVVLGPHDHSDKEKLTKIISF
ncbi:MAG: insulinase family protein [Candidatus Spechtbacteria bacterium]|nr:insulinase family protein [Candidatus Spechtbacteria bacterium]